MRVKFVNNIKKQTTGNMKSKNFKRETNFCFKGAERGCGEINRL